MKRQFLVLGILATTFFITYTITAQTNSEELLQKVITTHATKSSKTLYQNLLTIPQGAEEQLNTRAKKDWNFLVYFAANNNLNSFALENIRQMVKVGSSASINVLIQLDELNKKEMTRFYIQKNKALAISTQANTQECISGTKESLFDFARWAIKNYPANHNCLILWNHGSGIKDPSIWGKILLSHRDELFVLNENTGLLELNRKLMRQKPKQLISDIFTKSPDDQRGIAFNDTFETYLTNQDLKITLEKICKELLNGQKLDLLCMDACHMEMIEVGSQIKNTAKFMVGSEEVEPGSGYNYTIVLSPFENNTMSPENFAKHIVTAYKAQYNLSHADYTQSAIDLEKLPALEQNFIHLTALLTELANGPQGETCLKLIRDIRTKGATTTEFNDPDYIDLGHFYKSLYASLNKNTEAKKDWSKLTKGTNNFQTLKNQVVQGMTLLAATMVTNAAGPALGQATGLAFYFPMKFVHKSYYKTVFDQSTQWSTFLNKFIKTHREQKRAF